VTNAIADVLPMHGEAVRRASGFVLVGQHPRIVSGWCVIRPGLLHVAKAGVRLEAKKGRRRGEGG
jgi:hypothetical protein